MIRWLEGAVAEARSGNHPLELRALSFDPRSSEPKTSNAARECKR
ncbi:MAG TPA: hypothetical protein VLZ10_18220 [Thermodesulfobacteriota bacterium]|nr:hypothetical protein [Thermodesulfobacteriota bacterium]